MGETIAVVAIVLVAGLYATAKLLPAALLRPIAGGLVRLATRCGLPSSWLTRWQRRRDAGACEACHACSGCAPAARRPTGPSR